MKTMPVYDKVFYLSQGEVAGWLTFSLCMLLYMIPHCCYCVDSEVVASKVLSHDLILSTVVCTCYSLIHAPGDSCDPQRGGGYVYMRTFQTWRSYACFP